MSPAAYVFLSVILFAIGIVVFTNINFVEWKVVEK